MSAPGKLVAGGNGHGYGCLIYLLRGAEMGSAGNFFRRVTFYLSQPGVENPGRAVLP